MSGVDAKQTEKGSEKRADKIRNVLYVMLADATVQTLEEYVNASLSETSSRNQGKVP